MLKLFNILGMVLQFFSFWFAAPELLGEEKLIKWEDKIKEIASKIPAVAFGVPAIVLISIFIVTAGKMDKVSYSLPLVFLALLAARKRLQQKIKDKLITPFLDSLIENQDSRQKYLRYAAMLFTIGFILSLTAVVLG